MTKEQEKLIEDNITLVYSIVRKLNSGRLDDDLVQIGKVALIKATSKFDKRKKTKVSTYAFKKITGSILNYLIKERNILSNIISLDSLEESGKYNKELESVEFEELIEKRESIRKIREIINTKLSDREKEIIILNYYGGFSFEEIGKYLGLGSMWCSEINTNALKKIKTILEGE